MLIARITWSKIALRLLQLNPAELCRIDTSFTKLFVWLRFYFYTMVTKIKFLALCKNFYLLKNLEKFEIFIFLKEARVITITGFAEMTTSWSRHEFHDRKSIINFKSRTWNLQTLKIGFQTRDLKHVIWSEADGNRCLTKYRMWTRKNVPSMIESLTRIMIRSCEKILNLLFQRSLVMLDGNILHLVYGSNLPLTKIGFEKIKFIF